MITRRSLLAGGTSLGLAAALGATPVRAATRRAPLTDVFRLGVASGEPEPDGVVLWTRLAVDPLAPDGLGGMPDRPVLVQWQVAKDENFKRVVRSGAETARLSDAHSVHVEVGGLQPGAEYFYRFRAAGELSPVGRTLTAPTPGSDRALNLSFTSCADYQLGWFTAYRRMAEDQPDLIAFLGDYIYEYGDYKYPVRDQAGGECFDLAGYRLRHTQHKADPELQLAHAIAPWVAVFDDHDVENAWAGDVPEQPDPPFLPRRAAAFQAFYENMPLRRAQKPQGAALHLYHTVRWGSVANLHLLDTRQYRDIYACNNGRSGIVGADCTDRLAPNRTILGEAQESWLEGQLGSSDATWDLLVQQVFFMEMDWTNGAAKGYSNEGWDGYVASRNRVAAAIDDHGRNGVVLTGDVHSHWAGEIKRDYQDPESKSVAVELVSTSVTSEGNGMDEYPNTAQLLAENPHVKFFNGRRGYVRSRISRHEMTVDFRSLGYVTQPYALPYTSGSFVIEPGTPRLNPA